MDNKPRYSVCMCNYNMADTLERSLRSLLVQLDDRFEVILLDDGSSDNSVKLGMSLADEYSSLRVVALPRDRKRKLGFTRNLAIKEAKGEYVLLHLDCDDIFGPHICDFVDVFERIEQAAGRDILLSGQHINMAKKDFLLKHGPYINIYRGEDRDLWSRLGAEGAWLPLDHIDFITRIPKKTKRRLKNVIWNTFDHMKNDFRAGTNFSDYLYYEIKYRSRFSLKNVFFRLSMLLPAWAASKLEEPIDTSKSLGSHEIFASYRQSAKGTYREIMERYGACGDVSFLSPAAQNIFSNVRDDSPA